LAIDEHKDLLYAVSETEEFAGEKGGGVYAFKIDRATGELNRINAKNTQGGAPCHLSMDKKLQWLFVANYLGGNVAVFPLEPGGSLGNFTDVEQHTGRGGDPNRQVGPHAHAIHLDPSGESVYVADLGIDQIVSYHWNSENGELKPRPENNIVLPPGAGPRHFTFHPTGKFMFIIRELDSKINSFVYEEESGVFQDVQTVATVPEDYLGENYCADIQVHPNGKFLYGSNRGHDSIVIFTVDADTGRLEYVAHESTRGKWPRNFGIDPKGNFLVVANRKSNDVQVFRIDQVTGRLDFTGHSIAVDAPSCIKFLAVK